MFTESLDSLLSPMLDRLTHLLDVAEAPSAFVALSLDLLKRKPELGMLANFRADGYAVTPVP